MSMRCCVIQLASILQGALEITSSTNRQAAITLTRSSILGLGDASRLLHRRHPIRQRSDTPPDHEPVLETPHVRDGISRPPCLHIHALILTPPVLAQNLPAIVIIKRVPESCHSWDNTRNRPEVLDGSGL